MIPDDDLAFLGSCSNEELEPLVKYILSASTNGLDVNDKYKSNVGNHQMYVDVLVREILEFGGNTFMNIFRGNGIPYSMIVRDVANKIGASGKFISVEETELRIVTKILADSVAKMSDAQHRSFEEEFQRAGAKYADASSAVPLGIMLAQGGVRIAGFSAYRISVVVANAVAKKVLSRGLTLATNAALTRGLSLFAGPVGWMISGVWTAVELAGPAYRVTIPAVCHTTYLRQKKAFEQLGGLE